MTRKFAIATIAALICASAAFAAEDSQNTEAKRNSDGVRLLAGEGAIVPVTPQGEALPHPAEGEEVPAGGADTSTGAKEQSSAPPGSEASKDMEGGSTAGTSSDTSTGAKEQSSAPPDSAAAGDVTTSTDKASCDQAGGMWDQAANKCSKKSM